METNKRKRLKKAIAIWICILVTGMALAMILIHWDLHLPCIFREITGYMCPGCGVTRMFKSIICLDFTNAFKYNPVVFLMLPLLVIIFINLTFNYVKKGSMAVAKPLEKLILIMIIVLVCFGIIRNL